MVNEDNYDEVVQKLSRASQAYYLDGSSELSDREFDELMREVSQFEADNGIKGFSQQVGSGFVPSGSTVKHVEPMLSLSNVYSPEEAVVWVQRREADAGVENILWSLEPKLDGSAVALQFVNGNVVQAVSRGDGVTGEIIEGFDQIVLPSNISVGLPQSFWVRGEVLMTGEQYKANKAKRLASGKSEFKNARNATAGILRRENKHRTEDYELSFVAYDAIGIEGDNSQEISDGLLEMGFETTLNLGCVVSSIDLEKNLVEMEDSRDSFDFELDGIVLKAVDFGVREVLGFNSKAPRWGVAMKMQGETAVSVVEDIEFALGKSGRVTMRARIKPTDIGGTTVTYCTVHNYDWAVSEGILVGAKVVLTRAGDVIPRITSGVGGEMWFEPEVCPNCAGDLERDETYQYCRNSVCSLPTWLEYAASRDALDLNGVSSGFIERALDVHEWIQDLADFLSLSREQISKIEGYESRAGDIAFEAIQKGIREATLDRLLISLVLPMTGRSMSRRIAEHFGSLDKILVATVDDMTEIDKMGFKKSEGAVGKLIELKPMIERLVSLGFQTEMVVENPVDVVESEFSGLVCYVTGKMPLKKDECKTIVEKLGGIFKQSSKVDVIIGAPSAKVSKFVDKGSRHVTVDEFMGLAEVNNLV